MVGQTIVILFLSLCLSVALMTIFLKTTELQNALKHIERLEEHLGRLELQSIQRARAQHAKDSAQTSTAIMLHPDKFGYNSRKQWKRKKGFWER